MLGKQRWGCQIRNHNYQKLVGISSSSPFSQAKSKDDIAQPLPSLWHSDHLLHWVWLLLGIPLSQELIVKDGKETVII